MSTLNVSNINEVGGVDAIVTSGVLDSGSLPAGSIIAVKDALFTGTQSSSVAAGGNVAVTDLSITHEVSNPSNKLIISAVFGLAANGQGYGNTGIAVHDGTGLINVGDSAGSRTSVSAGAFNGQAQTFGGSMPSLAFVYTPGAGSKTYTVRAINMRDSTETLFINRNENDIDDTSSPRAVSSLVIQEVAV